MVRIALVVASIVMFPLTSFGGPKEEAQAVADKFIAAFVAGDLEGTAALYSPDALFWGTVSPELGTSPNVLRAYFADNYAARAKVPLKAASITDSSALVLSDEHRRCCGTVADGAPDRRLVASFHDGDSQKGRSVAHRASALIAASETVI